MNGGLCYRQSALLSSLVQIPDRLAFGTQRTNVLLRNDLGGQAVNLVTLCRRPAAKALHAFQKAEPEDLGIFADARELKRVLAGCNKVPGRKFDRLAPTVLEFGRAANDAIN